MSDTLFDQISVSNRYAELPEAFYARVAPQPPAGARVLHVNPAGAALTGLPVEAWRSARGLAILSGAEPLPGGITLAAIYSGHQFGQWAGQLGDGRAHLLGAIDTPAGSWEIQLKGSGRTPYSRMGDGRAVLRSSVREYLAAEAMHGLGLPTTRSLALLTADEPVWRETRETAAIVARLAPSFIRFGSFEHWYAARRPDRLQALVDAVIDQHYPECRVTPAGEPDSAEGPVLRLLREVTRRTATLMAGWLSVGFCHGVMNTDNMSILGLTLDYGPYGFMDGFQADHICNHTDSQGRYAWNTQPSAAYWNLRCLAAALQPLVADDAARDAMVDAFEDDFHTAWHARLAAKLGLSQWDAAQDDALIDRLWRLMHAQRADFTLTFRSLSDVVQGDGTAFDGHLQDPAAAAAWREDYLARLANDPQPQQARLALMQQANPLYVLRNHLAEQAIRQAEQGDVSAIERLLHCLANPWVAHPGYEDLAAPAPEWAAGLSISCSS